jgi:hypothetical protein
VETRLDSGYQASVETTSVYTFVSFGLQSSMLQTPRRSAALGPSNLRGPPTASHTVQQLLRRLVFV